MNQLSRKYTLSEEIGEFDTGKNLKGAPSTRFQVAALLDESQQRMNGHATQEILDMTPPTVLIAEYARAKGVLKIQHNGRIIEIPGGEIGGDEIVYLSQKAIEVSPGINEWLRENPDCIRIEGEYLVAIHLPEGGKRGGFFDIVMKEFSSTATSPLKHDIVELHLGAGDSKFSTVMEGVTPSMLGKMLRRKFNIGNNPNWQSERTRENHERHYEKLLGIPGIKPPQIYLTLSGKSANTAVIRDVSKSTPPNTLTVYPGYFFLNEPDFPEGTKNTIHDTTQGFFASVESGYAGIQKEEYDAGLLEAVRKMINLASRNTGTSYSISLDVTSDILSFQKSELGQLIQKALKLQNLRVIITSSLTKYNRNEPNYHFGIIADFSGEDPLSLDVLVETSYGGLSPLGILQYPRLKKNELEGLKSQSQKSGEAFLSGFKQAVGDIGNGIIEIESYTPYSYIRFPGLPEDKRNRLVSEFLKERAIRPYVGSSFYLEDFRICDVPDVNCSRFGTSSDRSFRNNIRVSFPTGDKDAAKMGLLVGEKIRNLLQEATFS
ncbi:MAG: hypothetical protein HHAS10_09760 [Candidatus Altimarinota bacterium]